MDGKILDWVGRCSMNRVICYQFLKECEFSNIKFRMKILLYHNKPKLQPNLNPYLLSQY
jgi:hypothetical protein